MGSEFTVTRITHPSYIGDRSLGTWYAMGDANNNGVWAKYLEKIEAPEDMRAEVEKLQAQVRDLEAQLGQPAPVLVEFTDLALIGLQCTISDAIASGMVEASIWQQGRN